MIRALDAILRRALGVFAFRDDEDCILRIRFTTAPHPLPLPEGTVPRGALVVELHLWNEHIPPLPPEGPNLAWAVRVRRMLIHSFRLLAAYLEAHPQGRDIRALGGVTVLLAPGGRPAGERLIRRLGFVVLPYHNPLGRFGEFWENLFTWWLMWTFNEASLRHRQLLRLRRTEVWIGAKAFLRRYGGAAVPRSAGATPEVPGAAG